MVSRSTGKAEKGALRKVAGVDLVLLTHRYT